MRVCACVDSSEGGSDALGDAAAKLACLEEVAADGAPNHLDGIGDSVAVEGMALHDAGVPRPTPSDAMGVSLAHGPLDRCRDAAVLAALHDGAVTNAFRQPVHVCAHKLALLQALGCTALDAVEGAALTGVGRVGGRALLHALEAAALHATLVSEATL
mmetsp:Transcript_113707/g.170069  ORF Transcript_113707/g.170069 Transcript_113707/m.170069 type:complete len:158 (-) Transcript_113707:4608-5081(-)